ncbi:MAG: transcription-repair coupling factor [Bacteroidota bacterium]
MKPNELLKLYKSDSIIQSIAEEIKTNEEKSIQIKNVSGSLDAILVASVYQNSYQNQLVVLHDKEEAAYFFNDLQNLLSGKEVLFFPTSYKRPYEFEETENANILMRAEILNRVNHKASSGEIIVTYPEALTERVVNKKSLQKNTFTAKIGEKIDSEFLSEVLLSYDFEKADFVYEAGQFAVRGGIIDVFSFAHDLPYRIEMFGDEIESIRTFDPTSQLSVNSVKEIHLIPNIQTKLVQEQRQGFIDFLPNATKLWFKDVQQSLDIIDNYFEKAIQRFEAILKESGDTQVVTHPDRLFETSASFKAQLDNLVKVEFGNRFYLDGKRYQLKSQPQPSFNKNFKTVAQAIHDNQTRGFTTLIASDSMRQLERLHNIFLEIDHTTEFQDLNVSLRNGFTDETLKIACYTDHEIFERFHRYKTKDKHSKSKALTLKELRTLQPGDFVTHIDYGIGKFAGLERLEVNGHLQESIRLIYRDDDLLYVSIHSLHKISKYTGQEGTAPSISKLGSPEWENKKKKAKKKVAEIAEDLINLYAKRKKAPGYAYSVDSFLQAELESSFIYEDTPDQAKATNDVKEDMQLSHPMDRLVCGDVGFGKTEVAIRAAFKAVVDNKQVAVLVPTTILAMQHHRTFSERLATFPVNVEYINRFKTSKEIKETLKRVESGETNILIGTHRIVSKDVKFKDLGLMIIDEEQKFGVKVKERLKELRVNVDALTLTATPIPRTLHFSLMGARDLSIISTPPPNRQPVTTELHSFNQEVIRDAVSFELRRGGQVFFVHNRISDIDQVANIVLRLVPDARVGVAHGQMDGAVLEKAMVKFIEGEYDVLVSTNIIESGLDIPNANTIIINQAHMFGLSDLHQMRGRVGRSNKKAFCYLLSPPTAGLSSDARKRLSTLEEFSDLGDGFKVAMRDLDIRGAGNLLGSEQSGFITDLGFDTYHKILDEAVQELKETQFRDLFEKELSETVKVLVQDCTIETDLELIIPDSYVNNISERLSLYAKLDNIKDEEQLVKFSDSLLDRFGPLPDSVAELIDTVRLRWKAEKLGFEKLNLKSERLKAYFVPSDRDDYFKSEEFGSILTYVQAHPTRCKLREHKTRLILTVDEILNVTDAKTLLDDMLPTEILAK